MKPCKGEASCRTCAHYKYCSYDMKHAPKTAKRIKLKSSNIKCLDDCTTCPYYCRCYWEVELSHNIRIALLKLRQLERQHLPAKDLNQAQEFGSYIDDLINFLHRKGL